MSPERNDHRKSANPMVFIALGCAFTVLGLAGNRLFLVAALFFLLGGVLGAARARNDSDS